MEARICGHPTFLDLIHSVSVVGNAKYHFFTVRQITKFALRFIVPLGEKKFSVEPGYVHTNTLCEDSLQSSRLLVHHKLTELGLW